MLKEVFEIDKNGFIKEIYTGEVVDGMVITDFEGREIVHIDLPQPNNFHKPKWNGEEWVEGETEEEKAEREAISDLDSLNPSQQEMDDADLEIKVLTLLYELEVLS